MRIVCVRAPMYGKWYTGKVYKIYKVLEDRVLVRDEKNERKDFALDSSSRYFIFNYFIPANE